MLLQLASIGILIALIPLCYAQIGGNRNSYRRLVWITAFLTLDLIMFGSFTRLTDSGLGCPDWPGCYGVSNPFHARADIHAAQTAMPTGPVTWTRAWIEMTHRYLALALGVLIIMLTALAWARRGELKQSPWHATAVLGLVCVQGALGAWTVTLKLQPSIVVLHLLLGMLLLAALAGLGYAHAAPRATARRRAPRRAPVKIGLILLVVQIALGGWVSANYAVLACTDFPLCNGQWIPEMNIVQGFTFWRALGKTASGDFIAREALVAIHWMHRMFAIIVLAYLTWLGLRARRTRIAAIERTATLLLTMLALQLATGLSNIVLGWPLLAAVAHNGGAAVLLLLMVRLHYLCGLAQARASMPAATTASSDSSPMDTMVSTPTPAHFSSWRYAISQYLALTKPRVTQLAVFCAVIGMLLATPGMAPWPILIGGSAGIWLLAGAAFAINCLVEREIDARMRRTAWRPSASGTLGTRQILLFSLSLGSAGMWMLHVFTNDLTMWLTFATFIGYAVIYTLLLKPATPQNIVIGGLSGAMPPALGWSAVAGNVSAEAWILVLILFTWTPPHFWALALYRRADYARSGLPMLPITHGEKFTLLHILLYTLIMIAATLLPFVHGMSSYLYLAAALALGLVFLAYAWRMYRHYSDALARKTFRYSILYLSLLFSALLIDHYSQPELLNAAR